MQIAINSTLGGRYRIDQLLGQGGFGEVWRAHDTRLRRDVAVKVLYAERLAQHAAVERFIDEARVAAAVAHPSIVVVHDVDDTAQDVAGPFIVMELLTGHSLHDELYQNGPMPMSRAVRLLSEALEGLGEAHARGIVHKDLKPGNLVLVQAGQPTERLKIVDFGLAHVRRDTDPLARDATFSGTPRYCAPEYARERLVTPALDVYQMGLILVEMLSGKPVVDAPNPMAHLARHMTGRLEVPEWLRQGPLGGVIEESLSLDPLHRFTSAAQFAAALRAVRVTDAEASRLAVDPAADETLDLSRTMQIDVSAAMWTRGLNRFVGREAAVAELQRVVRTERLVTVLGPGGVGKSRLVREFLATQPGTHYHVDLAGVAAYDGIVARTCAAVGSSPSAAVTGVAQVLKAAAGAVLVLDNLEQAVEGAASLAHELFAQCPELIVIGTSRVALGTQGERRVLVAPLADAAALELLRDRVARRRGVTPGEEEDAALLALARRLDSMPLALELAASHLAVSSAADVLKRVEESLDAIGDARSGGLRRVFEMSWGLLDDAERLLLAQCAVFTRPFTLDWVRDVVRLPGLNDWQLADVFDRLVAKSVIRLTTSARGLRFDFFQTVREFAEEKLRVQYPEVYRDVVRRHAERWCVVDDSGHERADEVLVVARRVSDLDAPLTVRLARATAEVLDATARVQDAEDVLNIGIAMCARENIESRSAMVLQLVSHSVRVSDSDLPRYQRMAEELALELPHGAPRARILAALGLAAYERGDIEHAITYFRDALNEMPPEEPAAMATRHNLALALWTAGEFDEAILEVQANLRATSDRQARARMQAMLWYWRGILGAPEQAAARLDEIRSELESLGDTRYALFTDSLHGELWLHYDPARGLEPLRRALHGHEQVDDLLSEALLNAYMGTALLATDPRRSREHFAITAQNAELLGHEEVRHFSRLLVALAELLSGRAQAAIDELQGMTFDEAGRDEEPFVMLLLAIAHRKYGSNSLSQAAFERAKDLAVAEPLKGVIACMERGRWDVEVPPHPVVLRQAVKISRRYPNVGWFDLLRYLPLLLNGNGESPQMQ